MKPQTSHCYNALLECYTSSNIHTQRMKSLMVSGNCATICSRRGYRSWASRLPSFIASIRDCTMMCGNVDSEGQSTPPALSDTLQHIHITVKGSPHLQHCLTLYNIYISQWRAVHTSSTVWHFTTYTHHSEGQSTPPALSDTLQHIYITVKGSPHLQHCLTLYNIYISQWRAVHTSSTVWHFTTYTYHSEGQSTPPALCDTLYTHLNIIDSSHILLTSK